MNPPDNRLLFLCPHRPIARRPQPQISFCLSPRHFSQFARSLYLTSQPTYSLRNLRFPRQTEIVRWPTGERKRLSGGRSGRRSHFEVTKITQDGVVPSVSGRK